MVWIGVLFLVAVVAFGYALHRAALWAEGRGWIYYKTKSKGGGLSLIGQIYQPSIEYTVEEAQAQRIRSDQDESGDGDLPGDTEGDAPG